MSIMSNELINRQEVIDRLLIEQNKLGKKSPLEACGISIARLIISSDIEIPTIVRVKRVEEG